MACGGTAGGGAISAIGASCGGGARTGLTGVAAMANCPVECS